MKIAIISALVASVAADWPDDGNPVPIMPKLPGWRKGTPGANLDIRFFYDLFCPDSKANHYAMKNVLTMKSPVEGKTYGDLVDITVSPFVLPYHLHSWTVAQVVPYLDDVCKADSTKCY